MRPISFKNLRFARWKIHVLCWALYILNEQVAFFFSSGRLWSLFINAFYYACNIGLFYYQSLILSRYVVFGTYRFLRAGLFTLAGLILAMLIKFAGDLYFTTGYHYNSVAYVRLILLDLQRSLFFIGLATLIWSVRHMATFHQKALEAEKVRLLAERDKALLETQLTEVRSAYYQHQLNPHLLFNTLSFIYTRVEGHSEEAASSVLLLSEVLRFCIREPGISGKIPLKDELLQMQNLVEINRLRFGGELAVDFLIEGETSECHIIPLILLTLTENLFKHGLVNDPSNPALVNVKVNETCDLFLFIKNTRRRAADSVPGIGLRNIRLRLDNAYPGRYRLGIKETEDTYQLELKLSL